MYCVTYCFFFNIFFKIGYKKILKIQTIFYSVKTIIFIPGKADFFSIFKIKPGDKTTFQIFA